MGKLNDALPEQVWCGGCKEFHSRQAFGANASKPGGLQTHCKKYRSKSRKEKKERMTTDVQGVIPQGPVQASLPGLASGGGTRECRECGQVKPLTDFPLSGTSSSGKKHWRLDCKKCYAKMRWEQIKQKAEENKDTPVSQKEQAVPASSPEVSSEGSTNGPSGWKECKKCGYTKKLHDFHRSGSSKDGYQSYCKVCNSRKRVDAEAMKRLNSPAVRQWLAHKEDRSFLKKLLCNTCHELKWKNPDYWIPDPDATYGYKLKCRVCVEKERAERRLKRAQKVQIGVKPVIIEGGDVAPSLEEISPASPVTPQDNKSVTSSVTEEPLPSLKETIELVVRKAVEDLIAGGALEKEIYRLLKTIELKKIQAIYPD